MPSPLAEGWSLWDESGGAAQIVIPAPAANVQHVITHIFAYVLNLGLGGSSPAVQVLDGVDLIRSFTLRTVAPAGTEDSNTYDQTETIPGSPGTSMTVRFSGAVSLEQLKVEGITI